jgi:hypothetical protein
MIVNGFLMILQSRLSILQVCVLRELQLLILCNCTSISFLKKIPLCLLVLFEIAHELFDIDL